MKKHPLMKLFVLTIGISLSTSLFSQVTFQGVSDSTAIVSEAFTANVLYTVGSGGAPTFSLPVKPAGMSINSSGVISFNPNDVEAGGRVVVRAVNGAGTFEHHFNVYVSDAVVCSADLISYHKMDDASGTTFADYQGGPNATSATSLASATGRVGGARLLNPSSIGTQMISIPDNDQYEWTIQNDFSFAIWVYPLGKPGFSTNQKDDQVLFYSENTVTGARIIFGLDGQDDVTDVLKPKIRILNSAGDPEIVMVSSPEVTPNTWHHLAFSYDAVGISGYNLRIYLDGNIIENPTNAWATTTANFFFNTPMHIGWYNYPGYTVPFNGRMDEILIYNKALTNSDISAIYADGVAGEAHCKPGNHAPEFVNNFPSSVAQAASYFVQLATNDIESDPLTIGVTSIPDWMSYNSTTKRLTNKAGRPNNSDVGSHSIVLTLDDGTVQVERTFPVTVTNVNDAPAFSSSNPTSVMNEDAHYVYTVTYSDIDLGDVVSISAPVKPNWLSLNTSSHVLSGVPTNDTLGTSASRVFNVTLRLNDGETTTDQIFTITVNNVNDAPVITGQDNIYTDESTPIALTPEVAFTSGVNLTDEDNVFPNDFTLTAQAGTNYTVSGGNVVRPADFFHGYLSVPVELSDGSASVDYTLVVNVAEVNLIPSIESTPETTADDYEYYEYTFVATDGDPEDVLVMNDSIVPSWLTFDAGTGVLSGTPKWDDIGDTLVILTVTDGKVTVVHDFNINVLNTNSIPEITTTPTTVGYVDAVYQYNLTAEDPDEDNILEFTAPVLPDWLNFTPEATQALVHGVPTEENLGLHPVLLQVNDGEGGIDQQSYDLVITVSGVDDQQVGTMVIYPSPASDMVYFEYDAIPANSAIEILNLNGKILYRTMLDSVTGKVEADISGFDSGIYLYRIVSSDQIITGKFMVE